MASGAKGSKVQTLVPRGCAMLTCLTNSVRGEEGATMVEYGLMLAFIALVSVGVVATIGTKVSAMFADVPSGLQ